MSAGHQQALPPSPESGARVHHHFSLPPSASLWLDSVPANMWERTLQDLIRGLRANKKDESKFIAKATDEIRREIKSDDMELKAGAVLKLTYVSDIV